MNHLPNLISDLALIMICAGIITILFKKLKQPVVLGYILAGILVGLLGNIEALSRIVSVINVGIAISMGLIYLKKLSETHDGFRLASMGAFSTALTSLLALFIADGTGLDTILTMVLLVPSLVGMYYEYTSYAEVLEGVDNELCGKWHQLWKFSIGCMGVTFCSLILVLLAPGLAAIAILVGAIGMLVASVLEWIYLYKTAKVFREIT